MSRDHLVVRPDRLADLLQFGSKLTAMHGSPVVVCQYVEPGRKTFDDSQIFFPAMRISPLRR
jgi:hypothetical protein